MTKLVYVAGYGRSGSTLLDLILGNQPDALSLGELTYLFHALSGQYDIECSCKRKFEDCPFWKPVLEYFRQHVPDADWQKTDANIRAVESITSLPSLILNRLNRKTADDYRRFHEALFAAIAHVGGSRRLYIDSSKSTRVVIGRPLALLRLVHMDVRVIYLVRDGRGVLWSGMQGSNFNLSRGESGGISVAHGYRSLVMWIFTNLLTLFMLRFLPRDRVFYLTYSELINQPVAVVEALQAFIGEDYSAVIDSLRASNSVPINENHLVGSNRMAQAVGTALTIKADESWKRKLPRIHRIAYTVLASPLLLLLSLKKTSVQARAQAG